MKCTPVASSMAYGVVAQFGSDATCGALLMNGQATPHTDLVSYLYFEPTHAPPTPAPTTAFCDGPSVAAFALSLALFVASLLLIVGSAAVRVGRAEDNKVREVEQVRSSSPLNATLNDKHTSRTSTHVDAHSSYRSSSCGWRRGTRG